MSYESLTPQGPGVGNGEAGGEDGVVLDAYSYVLPGMQEQAAEAMSHILM